MPATILVFYFPRKGTVGFENFPEILSLDISNNEDGGSGIGFTCTFSLY